jgi:Protein of unknown function DUF262
MTMNKRVIKANEIDAQILDFGLEATKEEMSVSQFMDRLKVFRFNDPIQRNSVWSLDKKSLLILSILQNVPIGHFMVQIIRDNKQKYRNILDGKQRLTTIRDFIKGKFALTQVEYLDGVDESGEEILIDVSGLTFEQLPKSFQDRITALVLEFRCFEMDDKLKSTLFYRWNNGEALKPAEKRKAKMSMELLNAIDEIKQTSVFQIGFNESALKRDANGEAVLQSMAVLITDGDTGLDNKTLDAMLDDNAFTLETVEEMKQITEYLGQVVQTFEEKQQKEIFKKNKITAMVLAAREAIKHNITPELFSDWVLVFFDKECEKRGFKQYLSGSTTKKEFVKKRIEIMMKDFAKHFSQTEVVEISA